MIKKRILFTFILSLAPLISADALVFNQPYPGNDLIGDVRIVASQPKDNMHKLARRYEMGYDEVVRSNPKVRKYGRIPAYTPVIIPSFFILPPTARHGIIINLPEKRLYYYPKELPIVYTEPITVGQNGWPTPEMFTKIIEKIKDPVWQVPESIQEEQLQKGQIPKTIVPAGPNNPLGKYALRLGAWSILLHGTNNPYSIGKKASHGCIRLYPEDIAHLFEKVEIGTPVRIIDVPYKIGWQNGQLYLEVHPIYSEKYGTVPERVAQIYNMIMEAVQGDKSRIHWTAVRRILTRQDGMPHIISK